MSSVRDELPDEGKRRRRIVRSKQAAAHPELVEGFARLAHTAVGAEPPSGPELRCGRAAVPLLGRPGLTVSSSLCVAEHGFSLHAATRAGAPDDATRERLIRYVLRRPRLLYDGRGEGGGGGGAAGDPDATAPAAIVPITVTLRAE